MNPLLARSIERLFGGWKSSALGLGGGLGMLGIIHSSLGCSVPLTDWKVWLPAVIVAGLGLISKK